MYAHRIETVIGERGNLDLGVLPFRAGEPVEVIILRREETKSQASETTSFAVAAAKYCGMIQDAPSDLSTNPAYMNGFGK